MHAYSKRGHFKHIWKKHLVNFCQLYTYFNMEAKNVQCRHLNFFFIQKGKNAKQEADKICAVYDKATVAETTVRKWFLKFKAVNEVNECSG